MLQRTKIACTERYRLYDVVMLHRSKLHRIQGRDGLFRRRTSSAFGGNPQPAGT
jgi:hypothetical protein